MPRAHDHRNIRAGRYLATLGNFVRGRIPLFRALLSEYVGAICRCTNSCVETMATEPRSMTVEDLLRLDARTLNDIGIDQRDALWLSIALYRVDLPGPGL